MKFFFLFALVHNCYGQASISAGMSRQIDNLFGENQNKSIFGKTQLNVYNNYKIQFDYCKSPFRVYGEMGFIKANYELIRNTSQSSGGGSSAYSSDNREYHANVFTKYFTGKLGLGAVVISKRMDKIWTSFSYNMFGQIDYLIKQSEEDQVMYRTTTSWSLQSQGYVTTNHPAVYNTYSLIQYNKVIFQYGMEMQGRIGFQNYFIELAVGLGIAHKYRANTVTTYTSYGFTSDLQNSTFFLNPGFKIGYLLKSKKNKKNKEIPEETI